ncbi:hypothetical protein RF11_04820 [Thelohanellus kitauei]|uniref:Tc1-like transposase DDE domain-containing protein n=1 Tax=Thelohanellus kitauei TaxID=669202 RepID=A0A0C2NA73_THEKT|nr:hypothetical protein RF11_04820 [Thelohanellus kitauei]
MNPEKLEIMKSMIQRGANIREIALDLHISQASARRYKRKIEEGQNLIILPKSKTINRQKEELPTIITQAVVNNNSITLGGVQTCLAEQGISRSVSTICRILKEESFSRKRLQKIPVERNSISNMDLRQNYCRMLSNLSDDRLIYIDETGINLHTSPNFGYAPISLTPRVCELENREMNISLLVEISLSGVVHFNIFEGSVNSVNGEQFKEFLMELSQINANLSKVYIMDNARIHRSSVVSAFVQNSNIRIEFLPPYSPQLNPIEEYFSRLKSKVRQRKTQNTTRVELKQISEEILSEDSSFNMAGYFRHMRRFVDSGLRRQEF